jgi:uncharacterized protein (DUF1697 family)
VTVYIALLRAVNVGGTGKLPMVDLKSMCTALGFAQVQTYIASGNALFHSDASAEQVKHALEEKLFTHAGKPVGVMVRTAAQMTGVLDNNPFKDQAGNRVVAIFLDTPPSADALAIVKGQQNELLALGKREIYVNYGEGMVHSKLQIPAAKTGTARNMNTVAKLVEMADALHLASLKQHIPLRQRQ